MNEHTEAQSRVTAVFCAIAAHGNRGAPNSKRLNQMMRRAINSCGRKVSAFELGYTTGLLYINATTAHAAFRSIRYAFRPTLH